MIDQGKFNLLSILINAIDYEGAIKKIIQAATQKRPLAVTALAVHGVMTGVLDDEHAYRLNHIDLVVPDGQPVRWALNWLYQCNLKDRVYGPNLMLKVCEHAAQEKLPIALYGSKSEVLNSLVNTLKQKYPAIQIVDAQPSKFRQVSEEEQVQIVEKIRCSGAQIVFVGLGCPRQEVWVYENRELLGIPAIAVGAAFDFHAGLLPQAPFWMQQRGLEWFFRLLQEPRRLWHRYVYLNPLYLNLLLMQKMRIRDFCPSTKSQFPKTRLRIG